MKYAIIGAGMSGLAMANILRSEGNEVIVYEKDLRPGGLIKCDVIDGCLFHRTGGHVFNTKRIDVMEWFWNHFDKERDFTKAQRNSSVIMEDGSNIPYPIENHVYLLPERVQKSFLKDCFAIGYEQEGQGRTPDNFEDFLKNRFGQTLYDLYFQPYNYKVWRRSLKQVPLTWLEGKLPMPTVEEMLLNNMNHIEERQFVHSSFYYPKKGGSQFLADRLADGLDIRYRTPVSKIVKEKGKLCVNDEECDRVVFCGNIKSLPRMTSVPSGYEREIENLEAHGTTSVFCEIDGNEYSWLYLPSKSYEAHRIICTGNFAGSNNAPGKMTGTVEFTDYISQEDIIDNLSRVPFHPRYIAHNYEQYTYPIQDRSTRDMVASLKRILEKSGIYLLGRFAEWEYCNMDVAIGSALDLNVQLQCSE